MSKSKTARKNAKDKAKFRRRRAWATGQMSPVFRRKQLIRLKRKRKP